MKRVLTGIAAATALVGLALAPGSAGAQEATVVTLVHAIPNLPVDVAVDGVGAISDLQPGQSGDLTPQAGKSLVGVVLLEPGTNTELSTPVDITLPSTGNTHVVLGLDSGGANVVTVFENNPAPVGTSGNGRLTVRHVSSAGAVDIVLDGSTPISNLSNGAGQDIEVPAGDITGAQIAPTGGDAAADLPTLSVKADVNLIVYVSGDGTVFYQQEVALPAAPDAETTTTVDPNATTTTVDPNATTTTSTTDPNATTTTSTTTTTTTTLALAEPTAVNTGSPLGDSTNYTLLVIGAAALAVAGGAVFMRRRDAA